MCRFQLTWPAKLVLDFHPHIPSTRVLVFPLRYLRYCPCFLTLRCRHQTRLEIGTSYRSLVHEMPQKSPAKASVPYIYRLILLTVEPLFAVMGSALVLVDPSTYLGSITRHSIAFAPDTTFLYTALGGSWLYFAFVEAVVLRLFDDLALWRVLCLGMLLSDFAFCHSTAQAVGGWSAYVKIGDWTAEDWVAFATTAPMVLTRVLIVLGAGVKRSPTAAVKGE